MADEVLAVEARLKDFISKNIKTIEKNFKKSSTGMQNQTSKLNDSTSKLMGSVKNLIGAYLGFRAVKGVINFYKESLDLYGQQEMAITKMNAALKTTGA